MNLNPGLFLQDSLVPADLPIPILPGTVNPNAPITTPRGSQRSSAAIALDIQRARRGGASPQLVQELQREYATAKAREAMSGAVTGINPNAGTSPAAPAATPSTGKNLLTFALLTSPAWGLLAAMHLMRPRRAR